MKNLSKEDILSIPTLKTQGLTNHAIASKLGVKTRTIQNWVALLRKRGIHISNDRRGRRKIIDSIDFTKK